jgi:hypothetical protein
MASGISPILRLSCKVQRGEHALEGLESSGGDLRSISIPLLISDCRDRRLIAARNGFPRTLSGEDSSQACHLPYPQGRTVVARCVVRLLRQQGRNLRHMPWERESVGLAREAGHPSMR